MKTLTELSGSVIRVAAAAVAEAVRSLPGESPPREESPEAAEEATSKTSAETPAAVIETADAAPLPPTTARQGRSDVAKEVIEAAVAKATGLSGDRLVMLHGAVEAAGLRIDDVRLVRVFGEEEQVPGATKVGAYQYVVDRFPTSMRQVTTPGGDRGGRGGGRGGRGGRGGGDRGVKGGGGVGGFSMDSLREDRKGQRGARGGPGRGRGPGGRGGGGGSGGPPSGAPKK